MLDDDQVRTIEQNARERFDQRVSDEGRSARALGWDSKSSMRTRFEAATEMYDFSDERVLDVGCGFGDFYDFLIEVDQEPATYHGVDISPRVLKIARNEHDDEATFEQRNVLLEPFDGNRFDIAVEFGLLNFDFEDANNEQYARRFMRDCYTQSDAVLLNCLSSYREGDWEFEEFVYYYDPEKIFGYAQELTRDIVLKHDFEPIPQKEFNLLLQ